MCVAGPLSEYIKNPNSLKLPPEGTNSGYLVIQDQESEKYSSFGFFKNRTLEDLPFPQNKDLTVCDSQNTGRTHSSSHHNRHKHVYLDDALFIPVLNLPLSSNRYYAIKPHGNHKGRKQELNMQKSWNWKAWIRSLCPGSCLSLGCEGKLENPKSKDYMKGGNVR
ncbi:hypothetical protein ACH5RR_036053 [Cinchona calisaya]|uniref:Uncharacterized protein n=1 Tax=Cinchona calisaya TaxID=153742 RepID=A0ABD2Y6W3_9GENT